MDNDINRPSTPPSTLQQQVAQDARAKANGTLAPARKGKEERREGLVNQQIQKRVVSYMFPPVTPQVTTEGRAPEATPAP